MSTSEERLKHQRVPGIPKQCEPETNKQIDKKGSLWRLLNWGINKIKMQLFKDLSGRLIAEVKAAIHLSLQFQ